MLPGGSARQLGVSDRLVDRIGSSKVYAGAILVGSLAADSVDAMSDVDLIVVVSEGRFPAAWASRSQLEGGESIAAWDEVPSEVEKLVHTSGLRRTWSWWKHCLRARLPAFISQHPGESSPARPIWTRPFQRGQGSRVLT